MGVSGLRASNDMMQQMMQTLMQGMQKSTDLSKAMISIGVENTIIGEKMSIAQQIIDVYA
jgi:hypothetical protein